MNISKLKQTTKVVVHANCPDGIASAMILKDALNLAPEQIFFTQHDTPEYNNILCETGMLFCDCTPPQNRIPEFVAAGTIVLDHHKWSRDVVAAFGENGAFADFTTEPEVSGARLAYREVWVPIRQSIIAYTSDGDFIRPLVNKFSHIAGVRDNWQLQSEYWEQSKEQAALLIFMPINIWMNQSLGGILTSWDYSLGKILVEKDMERAVHIAAKRWTYRTDSGMVIAIIPSRFISDASDLLEDECSVVIGFSYVKNEPGCYPGLLLSLRSFKGSFDCGKFCKTYGGGGHMNSAGCKFETEAGTLNPYKFICDKMDEYLCKVDDKIIPDTKSNIFDLLYRSP